MKKFIGENLFFTYGMILGTILSFIMANPLLGLIYGQSVAIVLKRLKEKGY